MTHFHANVSIGYDDPDRLFGTEIEARRYLATKYVESAAYFIHDESCEGDLSLVWESFEMARAILTGDGEPLSWDDGPILDGREWQDPTCPETTHWFERCSKPECGSWTFAEAS